MAHAIDQTTPEAPRRLAAEPTAAELARALAPGVLLLRAGRPESADERALALLGLADAAALAAAAGEIAAALAEAGLGAPGTGVVAGVVTLGPGGRTLSAELRRLAGTAADGGLSLLLLADPAPLAAAASDLQQACHLRTVTRISPAVAHDLRAPINAMVFNLEILKETIAAGKGAEPAGRERQQRYVTVLRDELTRLHRELENFLAQTSGRGDREETLDLREPVAQLVALLVPPGRKIQVQVGSALPEQPVHVTVNAWQLRQALLQVGVAALERIAHPGRLTVTLAAADGRARLTLAGPAAPEPPELGEPAEASFGLDLSPRGTDGQQRQQLHTARALLAAQGGAVRPLAAGGDDGFEVELPIPAV